MVTAGENTLTKLMYGLLLEISYEEPTVETCLLDVHELLPSTCDKEQQRSGIRSGAGYFDR
jgi:hypothetical protein